MSKISGRIKGLILEIFGIKNGIGIWQNIRVLIAKIRKTPIIDIDISGKKLYIRPNSPDLIVASDTLGSEFYSIGKLLEKDFSGFIIDLGGYIGSASIAFATMFPKAKIICIEPSDDNFNIILTNVEPYNNITPIKAALVSSKSQSFSLRNRGTGQWGYTTVNHPSDSPSAEKIQDVSTITLKELFERFPFSEIGLMKIDIEGAEADIFRFDGEILKKVDAILIELHDKIDPECSSLHHKLFESWWNIRVGHEKILSLSRK